MRRVALAVAVLIQSCSCNKPPPPLPGCSNCLGCCNENNLCESGLLPSACGFGGGACVACADGVACVSGTCFVPTDGGPYPCGGSTCMGQQDNLCVKGQCTCGGNAVCSPGSRCVGTHCECDPTTGCHGCCLGGKCLTLSDESTSQCGLNGQTCLNCADAGSDECFAGVCTCSSQPACDPGRACVGGQCECDPVTCADGCCQNGQCIHAAAQGPSFCQKQGHVCATCPPGLADQCIDANCSCGGGAACEPGQVCRDGHCFCDAASCGTGCCSAGVCIAQPQQTYAQCGPPGGTCIECPVGALCLPMGCDCADHLKCGAISVAAGGDFTCAVTVSGLVRCWGAALDGGIDLPVPQILPLPHAATAVTARGGFGCALTSGGLECFGATALGTYPVFAQASAGASHVCAVNGGQVFCWGDDALGQLGVAGSDGGFVSSPALVSSAMSGATAVSAGSAHTCAVVNGQVQCWGQIAAPPALDAGVVALASGDGVSCAAAASQVVCWGRASPVLGTFPLDAVALGVGSDFACAVLRSGALQCWGVNDHGQLGAPDGGPVMGLGQVTAVAAGRAHACAIGANLQVLCWGEGAHSKLGNGTVSDQPVPVPVSD